MAEEHHLAPVTWKDALFSAFWVFLAAFIGSMIVVVPFFFVKPSVGIWVSVGIAAASLFVMGAYKALRMGIGNPLLAGLELTVIGVASAMAGWGIGMLFALALGSSCNGSAGGGWSWLVSIYPPAAGG